MGLGLSRRLRRIVRSSAVELDGFLWWFYSDWCLDMTYVFDACVDVASGESKVCLVFIFV